MADLDDDIDEADDSAPPGAELTLVTPSAGPDPTPIDGAAQVQLGQWYWVTAKQKHNDAETGRKVGDTYEWLGCVTKLGSNYVKVNAPYYGGSSSVRIHFDNFWNIARHEPNADQVLRRRIEEAQGRVKGLLEEVRLITARLGVTPTQQITQAAGDGANALAVLSTQVDADAYKNALIEAKEKTLPELFKQIKAAHENLAKWMTAESLPLEAQIGPMRESIDHIEDRLHTLSLYAGLTEEAVQCSEGEPAAMGEKLRVMQRRLYMDEECLANYQAGGIKIETIGQFDAWIAAPENRDRLLPFPRTVAAFRVRRHKAEREDGGNFNAFVSISLAQQADKRTFLYVRNGEQVWRIICDFEFDEMIFSDQGLGIEPMMIKTSWSRVRGTDDFMPVREFEDRLRDHEDRERRYKAWCEEWDAANPNHPDPNHWFRAPGHLRGNHDDFSPREWVLFDPSTVYYDDALKVLQDEAKKQNRLAVIIQGLFDRSAVLHPHPPVQTWTAHGFERAVELIFDAATLTYGDPPDFEAYRARLNAGLGPDSIVTGQEDYWLRIEAARENKRIENDWRNRERTRPHYRRFRPEGNPGPGLVSHMASWSVRGRKATFRWQRATMRSAWRDDDRQDKIAATLTVPSTELFNVSAYRPGDFKRFYADPRTRQAYLKWAPLMLAAEDYHAGKLALGKPRGHTISRYDD